MKYEYTRHRNVRINELTDLEEVILKPYPQLPGFYIFPDDQRIAVSVDGNIYNIATDNFLIGHSHSSRSINIHIYGGGIKREAYKKHRILARTFIGRPSRHLDKDFSILSVNHVDGNRMNNHLSNLEWVTCQENSKHANALGLISTNTPVVALNIFSDEELYFTSVKECSEAFGIHRATLHKHLKTGNSGYRQKNGFIFKYDDGCDFTILPKSEIKDLGTSNKSKNIVVKDLPTGVVDIYSNIKEASKYISIQYMPLWRSLTKYGKYTDNKKEVSFL